MALLKHKLIPTLLSMFSKFNLQFKIAFLTTIFMLSNGGFCFSANVVTPASVAIYNSNIQWFTYEDKNLGFTLKLPGKPNYTDDYDTFTIYSYTQADVKTTYSFFALDLRDSKGENDSRTIIDNFITNIINNLNGELIEKKGIPYLEGVKYETLVKLNEEVLMRAQFTLQNNILYYLSVEDFKLQINNSDFDTFFNSLKITSPKEKEAEAWIDYTNKKGAFSVRIPKEPKDISREYPNPLDEEGEPYFLNLYMVTDQKNENNYLFRYNDQPLGYFLEDVEAGFEKTEASLIEKAKIVSPPKTIYLNGYEGREYELLLQEKYHTICRIYFRGNRNYLLLKQKLNENDKVSTDDEFFNSFKFEDYADAELVSLEPKNTNFEILFFEKSKEDKSRVDFTDIYLLNSNDYFATNPSSGGVYQFGYNDLQDYFKLKNKKEFYQTNVDALKEWNDTIIKQKDIKLGNLDAVEFYIQNKRTQNVTRHQLWLDNKRLFLMNGYLAKEELYSELTDSIFDSYTIFSKEQKFDIYGSKTDLIFEHLRSKDSTVYSKAFGAFDYYEFETSDLPQLYEAIDYSYKDEISTNAVRNKIIETFSITNDSTTLNVLKLLYLQEDTNDELKATLLSTLPDVSNNQALDVYKTLLFQSPPTGSESYKWAILSPLRDSLELSVKNYKNLLGLMEHASYRSDIIDISAAIIEEKKEQLSLISKNYDTLIKHALVDLEQYHETKKDEENFDYSYSSLMYSYLSFFNKIKQNSTTTDRFTQALLHEDDNQWMQLQAITARIFNELPLEKDFISKKLDSLFSRFEIIEAYHKTHQLKKIPKKYLKPEEFSRLALYNYVGEDEGYPDLIETLGTITKDKAKYYVFSMLYKTEEDSESESYMGIVGPIETISQDKALKSYPSYTEWNLIEKDWKAQALKLIPNLIEYGF